MWKTKREEDRIMLTIMNLVRQSKIKGVKKEKIWKELLRFRWTSQILKAPSSCLDGSQIAEVIFQTGQELDIGYDWNIRINEKDKELGKELYLVLLLCPSHLVEAVKLSVLFEKLLSADRPGHKYDLKTVVATTFHNIQPRAGDNIKDFTAMNMWYERLDERYNFSLGSNILPLMTTDNLNQLMRLDPPYMKDYNTSGNMSVIFGKMLVKKIS